MFRIQLDDEQQRKTLVLQTKLQELQESRDKKRADSVFITKAAETIQKIMSIEDLSVASLLLETLGNITEFGLETFKENELELLNNLKFITIESGKKTKREITEEDKEEILQLARWVYQLKEPDTSVEDVNVTFSPTGKRKALLSIQQKLEKANKILLEITPDRRLELDALKKIHSLKILSKKMFGADQKDLTKEQIKSKKTELDAELVKAVNAKDLKKVNALLKQGANPNQINASYYSMYLVLSAMYYEKYDIAIALIKNGADVNARANKSSYPTSPLELAVQHGNIPFIKFLLARGVNLNDRNKQNETIMMYITKTSNAAVVKELIDILLSHNVPRDLNQEIKTENTLFNNINSISYQTTTTKMYLTHLFEQYCLDPFIRCNVAIPAWYYDNRTPLKHIAHLVEVVGRSLEELAVKLKNASPKLRTALVLYAAEKKRTDILYDILSRSEAEKLEYLTNPEVIPAIQKCIENDEISSHKVMSFLITLCGKEINPARKTYHHRVINALKAGDGQEQQLRDNDSIEELENIISENPHIALNVHTDDHFNLLELAYGRRLMPLDPLISDDPETIQKLKEVDNTLFVMLLKNSNLSVRLSNNCTLLHLAVQYNAPLSDFLLLRLSGVNPDLCDAWSKKPIDYIVGEKYKVFLNKDIPSILDYLIQLDKPILESLELLSENDDPKQVISTPYVKQLCELMLTHPDKDGNTLLHQYTREGKMESLKKLFELPVQFNLDIPNKDLKTPLMIAIEKKDIALTELLLAKGASFNAKDKNGLSPLHIAIQTGDEMMVDFLLQHHSPLNEKDNKNNTPFLLAVKLKQFKIIELLLTHQLQNTEKIDIHYKNAVNESAIDIAVRNKDSLTVKLLIDHGANPNSVDLYHQSLLQKAVANRDLNTVKVLLAAKAAPDSDTFKQAIKTYDMDIITEFRKSGAIVPSGTIDGLLALHWAIIHKQLEWAKELIDQGADINRKDENGNTPLHLAVNFYTANTPDFVKFLLERGADPHARNNSRSSLLDVSKHSSQNVSNLFHSIFETKRTHTGFFKSNYKKGESHLLYLLKNNYRLEELPFLLKKPYPELLNALIKYAANEGRADVLRNIFIDNYQTNQLVFLNKKTKTIQKICDCLIQDNTLSYITKLKIVSDLRAHAPASSIKLLEKAYKDIEKGKIRDKTVSKKSFFRIFKKQADPPFFKSNKQYYNKLLDAVQRGLFNTVESLSTEYKDVNYNIKSPTGETLLDIAYSKMRYYEERISDAPTETLQDKYKFYFSGHQRTVHLLLEKLNINDRTIQNKTLLHLAIEKNAPLSDIVMFLLLGANTQLKDGAGKKPIDYLTDNTGQIKDGMKDHKELLENGIQYLFKPEHLKLLQGIVDSFSKFPPISGSFTLRDTLYTKLKMAADAYKTNKSLSDAERSHLTNVEKILESLPKLTSSVRQKAA